MDGDFSERRRSLDDVDPAAAASVAAASPLARVPLARARHHALLVPVLRLAGTLLNASPDQETRVAAVSFCRAHAAVLHRVLADRSKRAHMCDVAELEAAVALVARLVSFDTSTTRRRR
jgi:nuclear pore complex protein Nup205